VFIDLIKVCALTDDSKRMKRLTKLKIKIMKTLLKQLEINLKSIYGVNYKNENYKSISANVIKAYRSGNVWLAEEIVLNTTR